MNNQSLHGIVVPVITPIDYNERVDEPAFRKVLRRLVNAGVHGLFIGGSAGEGPLFTLGEWTRMVQIAHDEVKGELPILGGVMETSTSRIIEKLRILAQIGYEYYVVNPVFYINQTTPAEHLRLFGTCKEHDSGMELVAYNIPVYSRCEIPVEVLLDAARRGWVKYCKDSSNDVPYMRRLLSEGQDTGLKVLTGNEGGLVEDVRAGAVGAVPVCANYEPETFVQAYNSALNAHDEAAQLAQERILEIRDKLVLNTGACWLSGIKYAVSYLGIGTGEILSPIGPMTTEQKTNVEAFVQQPSPLAVVKSGMAG